VRQAGWGRGERKKAFKDKTIPPASSSCPIAPGYIGADCEYFFFPFLFGGTDESGGHLINVQLSISKGRGNMGL
jgi:hypothetical protein